MRLRVTICAASAVILTGCADRAPSPIPADLLVAQRTTCPEFRVEADVAACLVRYAASERRLIGQIEAIAAIAGGAPGQPR